MLSWVVFGVLDLQRAVLQKGKDNKGKQRNEFFSLLTSLSAYLFFFSVLPIIPSINL